MKRHKPNLAEVYAGRHLDSVGLLVVNDVHFKHSTEMMIRAYVDAYYFMREFQGDRDRALGLTLSGSNVIRRMLEMMVICEMIPADDAVTIYSICKYIGTDQTIYERKEYEWI